MRSVYFLRWLFAFSMLIPIACSDSVKRMTRSAAVVSKQELPAENWLSSLLEDPAYLNHLQLSSPPSVKIFYALQHNRPVWTTGNGLTTPGDSLLKILHTIPYYGLLPEDYHTQQIATLIEKNSTSENFSKLSELDILMTDALVSIGYHIRHGRIQKDSLYCSNTLPRIDTTLITAISKSVTRNNIARTLESLQPPGAFYKVLKQALKHKVDSLSLATTDSLHIKLEDEVRKLAVTMEQLRWEQQDSSQRYVLVNIPSFKLEVVERDSLLFESNVVVGTTETPTPTLDAVIKSFVLFPSWNVPRKIATQELLPKIRKDSSYLTTHHYRVYDTYGKRLHPDSINWDQYSTHKFPFLLQQSEGDHNALGIIKFVFANDYDVYLHDTNAKRFFQKESRAFSHGCVRVEKAIELAKFLIAESNRYCSPDDLKEYLATRTQRQVCVNPIDLRIRYYTCEARSDGSVAFHPDVYGLSGKLAEALYCRNN